MPATPTPSAAGSKAELKTSQPLLYASEEPNVGEMLKEFQRAGGTSVVAIARDRNDRIRYNRWAGRTSDYRKHRRAIGKTPVPWEDAWDGRVHLADGIIEDLTDVHVTAFERAQLNARPAEAGDIQSAGLVEVVLNKYRDRMRPELRVEAELFSQFALSNGASIMQVGWDRRIAMKMTTVTLDAVNEAAQKAVAALQEMPLQEIPPEMQKTMVQALRLAQIVLEPAMEEEVAEILRALAREMAAQMFTEEREKYGDDFLENYQLSAKNARKLARDLRVKGAGDFPMPYIACNQPFAVAREVGYDYFCPPEMTDVQQSAWHIVREWLTPEEIFARQISEGWDAGWCMEAAKRKGEASLWGDLAPISDASSWENDDEQDIYDWQATNTKSGLVEVLHFFKRYIGPEGVPQIFCTVFSPHAVKDPLNPEKEFYAKHYEWDSLPDQYPFVGYRFQNKKRTFTHALSVPTIVGSDQHAIKTTLDMLMDRAALELNPERSVPTRLGLKYNAGPGAQVPLTAGQGIKYADPPTGNPQLGFTLIEHAHKRTDNYFGLMTENVLPAKWQAKLQRSTERYLGACSAMWGMILRLVQRHADAATLTRIAGQDPQFPTDPAEIAGEYDVSLYFDVKDLDMEFVWKKVEALTKWAIPSDRGGLFKYDQVTRLITSAIDPTWQTALLQDQKSASQKLFEETRTQLDNIFAGFEGDYVENDPTAETKLQFAQQLIQGDAQGQGGNPKYQKALQEEPVVAERLQKWIANLQQSVAQEKNKTIGRLGVEPEGME